MQRGFGWKPELLEPDHRLRWGARLRTVEPPSQHSLVAELDLRGGGVFDQAYTSSCPGQATAGAIRLRLALMGHGNGGSARLDSYPTPSRRWLYRLARETHGEGNIDDGSYLSACLYVARSKGWPDEKHVPWDPQRVNDAMDGMARMHAYDQRDAVEEYAITSWGDERRGDIMGAIGSGYPIICGAQVDQAFCDVTDWTAQHLQGEPVGGHAFILVGYGLEGVHVLNSWGDGWGLGGLGVITWVAATRRIRDLRVVTLAKGPTS